jgi:hypothetical protein
MSAMFRAAMSFGSVVDKPRLFLGSSGKQEKLLQALTRGLGDIARVEPWMTSFNPGTSTLLPVAGRNDHS